MEGDDVLDPLAIILIKSGANGGRLLFRYPYFDQIGQPVPFIRSNPYGLGLPEDDLIAMPEEDCSSNIKNGQLYGFSDETLVNILAVSKCLCDAKFELKVNDVRFVGHPLTTGRGSKSGIAMFHLVFALRAEASYSIILCYHEFSKIIGLILKHEEERISKITLFKIKFTEERGYPLWMH